MFDLLDGEKIIYEFDGSNVKKTNKQYGRIFFALLVIVSFWFGAFVVLRQSININTIIIILILLLITISLLYGIIYNMFIYNKSKDEKYFITNMRIILIKDDEIKFGFINDIERIGILREKNNYSDILFVFSDSDLIKQSKNSICFKGIYNCMNVVDDILKNNNKIHLFDDAPTGIFGRM